MMMMISCWGWWCSFSNRYDDVVMMMRVYRPFPFRNRSSLSTHFVKWYSSIFFIFWDRRINVIFLICHDSPILSTYFPFSIFFNHGSSWIVSRPPLPDHWSAADKAVPTRDPARAWTWWKCTSNTWMYNACTESRRCHTLSYNDMKWLSVISDLWFAICEWII